VLVGWSLGGHVVLEAAPELPMVAGYLVSGTAPAASVPELMTAYHPEPAIAYEHDAEMRRRRRRKTIWGSPQLYSLVPDSPGAFGLCLKSRDLINAESDFEGVRVQRQDRFCAHRLAPLATSECARSSAACKVTPARNALARGSSRSPLAFSRRRALVVLQIAALVGLGLLPRSARADLSSGLVANWTFDDGTARDSSPNGNNGTVTGACASVPGRVNSALALNGGYVSVPDSPSLNPTSQLTITAWYNPVSFTGNGNNPIVDKGFTSHSPPFYQYHLGVTGDQYGGGATFQFEVAAGGSASGASTPSGFWTAGNWYHVAGTYDGAVVRLYVNGSLVASAPASGAIPAYGRPLELGQFSNLNDPLPGTIDEVRIYNRALTQDEIVQLAAGGTFVWTSATPTQTSYVYGDRPAPTSQQTTTYTMGGMDVLPGSNFTLGPYETIDLGNGNGTLTVEAGAVFSGNGVVLGNILNAGLIRIPIVPLQQWLNEVSGGVIQIVPSTPPAPGQPVVIPASSAAVVVNPNTLVNFSQGGGFAGTGFSISGDAPTVQGTLEFDASLDVSGNYTQTSTGSLRLFIAGTAAGVDYSQLRVGQQVTIDGHLEIVLQPELFRQFSFEPTNGETFDIITATGGITLAPGLQVSSLVTAAGASDRTVQGLTLTPFNSGIASDPDNLLLIGSQLFSVALAQNNTVLRATYLGPTIQGLAAVPFPTWALSPLVIMLVLLGARVLRRSAT
jgi:hypothetical protein